MTKPIRMLVPAVLLVVLVACSGSAAASVPPAAASNTPSTPASSISGSGGGDAVPTADDAARRVIALDPRFAGIGPKNPDLIGGCCFYEATPTADGFQVIVELGWGDCPAGCISRHRWTYAVANDGSATLVSETGDPVPAGFQAGGKGNY